MKISFTEIDVDEDQDILLSIRKDAHKISFGTDEGFDEEKYLSFVRKGS